MRFPEKRHRGPANADIDQIGLSEDTVDAATSTQRQSEDVASLLRGSRPRRPSGRGERELLHQHQHPVIT